MKKIATLDSGLVDSKSNANGQLIVDYGSNDLYLEQSSDHLVLINRPIKHLIVLMLLLVQEMGTSAEQFMSIFTTEKIYPEIKWCNYCSCKNKGLRQLIYALMRTNDKKYHRMMYNKMLKIKICFDFSVRNLSVAKKVDLPIHFQKSVKSNLRSSVSAVLHCFTWKI